MPRDFKLPDIGEGLTEAEIVRWLVAEGDRVEADQPIVEVETDKAVVEIPSPYAGIVLEHGGGEGDVIAVGSVLVVIGEDGEVPATRPEARPPATAPSPQPPAQTASPIVGTLSEEAETITPSAEPSRPSAAAVKALPVVRKLARDNGIDLEEVTGTGPNGRITREDVEAAITARAHIPEPGPPPEPGPTPQPEPTPTPQPEPTPTPQPEPTPTPEPGPTPTPEPGPTPTPEPTQEPEPAAVSAQGERRTMSKLRRTIATHMSISWSEIPHVTTFDDIDATRLLEVREALGDRHGVKIPLEALVVKAVIPALESFPEFNATLEGDDLILHDSHDIGIAVDTPDGLMVAVIPDAGAKGVIELAEEVRRLGEGARERTLTPDELGGQTFTVSNIGAVGGGHGTPIVPHGTTAILSVGRAKERPIVDRGELVIAPVMPLSLSYDHRVIDGAHGRRFMALVMENLEEPALFLT